MSPMPNATPAVDLRLLTENPRYAASSLGDIWSSTSGAWKKMSPRRVDKTGHLAVKLVSPVKGEKRRSHLVSRLVARAFLGEIPEGVMVLHRDDDPAKNGAADLYFGDARQNGLDAAKNCRLKTKLTPDQVVQVVALSRGGFKQAGIARLFRVSRTAVGKILRGEIWAHLTGIQKRPGRSRGRAQAPQLALAS
jgi:hypothetical protein